MPIRLGDPEAPTSSGNGPWNNYALVILWILQFGTVAFFEVSLGIYVLILGAFGGTGLMYVHEISSIDDIPFSLLFHPI